MHLYDFLDKSADSAPDAIAVIFDERSITYRELQRLTRKLAQQLMREPLANGSRIATYLPNHPASFICQYGVHRTPHVWLPLNPRSPIDEVTDTLVGFGVEWLFIHSDFEQHIDLIRRRVPLLKGCICVDREIDGCTSLDTWMADAPETSPEVNIGMLDAVALRTTGGSTGKPKGVLRTSLSNSLMIAEYLMALPYTAAPVNLVLTPLSHAAGEVAMPIFPCQGTQVILNSTAPQKILEAIEKYRVTTVFLPPTLIYTLLTYPGIRDFDFSSLKYIMYGSAPMSVQKLREACSVFGSVFAQIYGLSEATSTLCIMTPAEHTAALAHNANRLGSCGRPGPLYMVKVVGSDGRSLGPNEKGEIICAADHLMKCYFENPDATAETIKGGWLYTGDIGFKDEQGYVYIVDRKKDMIISGGFNVYPGEVEQVIFEHPAIKDCSVVGIPHDKWGEAVTAVVELKPGFALEEGELIALCKSKLGSIKAPKSVVIWEALPRSPAGKVLKKEVRAHFWINAGRSI
jgi:acyl-CoA synthetase (AMP-forming)/AMP-acid ligase II